MRVGSYESGVRSREKRVASRELCLPSVALATACLLSFSGGARRELRVRKIRKLFVLSEGLLLRATSCEQSPPIVGLSKGVLCTIFGEENNYKLQTINYKLTHGSTYTHTRPR